MKPATEITHLEDAFIISTKKNKYQIEWDAILKIIAYKLDLLTMDVICVDLYLEDNYRITLNEDEQYWDDFKWRMEKKLSINSDWWGQMVFPPFQRNEQVIFLKAS